MCALRLAAAFVGKGSRCAWQSDNHHFQLQLSASATNTGPFRRGHRASHQTRGFYLCQASSRSQATKTPACLKSSRCCGRALCCALGAQKLVKSDASAVFPLIAVIREAECPPLINQSYRFRGLGDTASRAVGHESFCVVGEAAIPSKQAGRQARQAEIRGDPARQADGQTGRQSDKRLRHTLARPLHSAHQPKTTQHTTNDTTAPTGSIIDLSPLLPHSL